MIILISFKFGFQANEAVTNLKLLEKGFSREYLAVAVLIDFPFSILFGYYAAKWSTGPRPLTPWMFGFVGRLLSALLNMVIVAMFPKDGVGLIYFVLVIVAHVGTSFMRYLPCLGNLSYASTIMFVSLTAFFTQISDPIIGGTYLTFLNTISNLGGTWPRFFVLQGVDIFTRTECILHDPSGLSTPTISRSKLTSVHSCHTEPEKAQCVAAGGECHKYVDGYYTMNTICIVIGFTLFYGYIRPRIAKLQGISPHAWKVPIR
jgi:MFS transporter, PAT family, solute carrier family 33 (acetyl-CoA transportor), member 1